MELSTEGKRILSQGTYVHPVDNGAEVRRLVDLIRALVMREWKGRYRRSILGPGWAIIQPLFYMVIFTFLRGTLKIPSDGVPYIIFTYSALVPWTFFSNATTKCGPSVLSNRGLVKKMSIAREVFPLAAVFTTLIDFFIASLILVGMMIWFRVPVNWSLLWFFPLLLLTALLALGVGLGIAAVGTYKQDITFGLPFLMQFWLLATPIMYPLSQVPERWRFLYGLNPMVGIIEGFRNILVKGTPPDLHLLLITTVVVVVVWAISWPFFHHMSQYFADVM